MTYQKGQALVTLLVFATIGIIITSAAVTITLINSQATGKFFQGEEVLHHAESGVENAILRIIRDSSYGGENINQNGSTVTISVIPSGSNRTIISEAEIGNFRRKIQVDGTLSSNKFTITKWSQID